MYFANLKYGLTYLIVLIACLIFIFLGFFLRRKIINELSRRNEFLIKEINFFIYNLKILLISLAFFFVIFSMLDPRWGSKNQIATLEGIDLVLAFDISRSMLTKDVLPDRLSFAKNQANKILAKIVGNRIGVTAFAGFAFNVLPLTTDIEAVNSFVNELSTEMIDVQGTNLEDAIKKALELFDFNELTHKAIVIITDGEDYEFFPIESAKEAKERGVLIFALGIGTQAGGMIPLYDEKGNFIDYLKKDGKIVTSRLNEKLLNEITKETGGDFYFGNDRGVSTLIKRIDEIKKSKFGTGIYEFLEPQFQYFLLISVLLLLIYIFLPEKRIKIIFLIFFLNVLNYDLIFASLKTRGVREYKRHNYEKALELFQKALMKEKNNERLSFNEGNTYFRLNRFNEAEISFGRILNSKNKELSEKTHYNLGNTYLEKNDYSKAIESYKHVLENANPSSEIYKKALLNFLYAKQQLQNQNTSQNQTNSQDQDNKQKQEPDKDNKRNQSERENSSSSASRNEQPQYSPTDVENLLNLIKEEEKKHIGKKEKAKALRVYPRNEW